MFKTSQLCNSEVSLFEKLKSLYIEIHTELTHDISFISEEFNSSSTNYSIIIPQFKRLITSLIQKKINNATSQYQNFLRNIEETNRQYIQTIFYQKLQIQSLEHQLNGYMEMEEEFEEMKIKLKYEEGTFLDNDRKENEILILRAENSNLKHLLLKQEKENEIKSERIEKLNKKIRKLELLVHNNLNKVGYIHSNKELNSTSSNITHTNIKRNVLNIKQVNINNVNYNLPCKPQSKGKNSTISAAYKNLLNDFSLIKDKMNDSNNNILIKANKKSASHSKGHSSKYLVKSPNEKRGSHIILNLLNNFPTSSTKKEKISISALAKLYISKPKMANRSSLNMKVLEKNKG